MTTIEITPTTTSDYIRQQIADQMRAAVSAFRLSRWVVVRRGAAWMIDDSVTGRQNIDGFYQYGAEDVETAAAALYRTWADLRCGWADGLD